MNILRFNHHPFFASLLLVIATVFPSCANAQDGVSQYAVRRAATFLEKSDRAAFILSYLHMGASCNGRDYLRTASVNSAQGYPIHGEFALVYRFYWDGDGYTDLAFLCSDSGNVESVQVVDTNAVLQQPFMIATGAIRLLGNAIIEIYHDDLTDSKRRTLQQMVNDADPKGLLEFALALQQAVGA